MNSIKLYILLLTIWACPLMATSDTPSSSSSSSLTALMSDTAESSRIKRKAIGPSYEEVEAEERNLIHAQKTLRSNNRPSAFSVADDSDPLEAASSSTLIPNYENSPASALYRPSSSILAPISRIGNIPPWFYAHEQSLLKFTFEYLNFADLTLARRVSKAFNTMAPQVIMPTGQQWITWCTAKFDKAKNESCQFQAIKEIIAATGRCPNAIANLRQIVAGYFKQVPAKLRFWNSARKGKAAAHKDALRADLGKILDRITELESGHQKAREAVKMQAQQSTVEKDLAALTVLQEKALAPLKEEKQKIIDLLFPALNALWPYELANTILTELDKSGLPEHLPIVPKNLELGSLGIAAIAKKRKIIRESLSYLAAACLPSVHASLFALNNDIVCLDEARRDAKEHIEKRLKEPVVAHEFDLATSLYNDQTDLKYYQIKIEQLRQTLKNIILKERSIPRNVIERNLTSMEADYINFIRNRIEKYLTALKEPDQTKKDAISNHILTLINCALQPDEEAELDACISRVNMVMNSCYNFLTKNSHPRYWKHAAYFAARVIALVGYRSLSSLSNAAILHFNAGAFKQAVQYFDLILRFKTNVNFLDFIQAGRFSVTLAHRCSNEKEAERHFKAASEKFANAMAKLPTAHYHELKSSSEELNFLDLPCYQSRKMQALAVQIQELRAAINAKIIEIEKKASAKAADSNDHADKK